MTEGDDRGGRVGEKRNEKRMTWERKAATACFKISVFT
jgi:hypothetical protein